MILIVKIIKYYFRYLKIDYLKIINNRITFLNFNYNDFFRKYSSQC